MKKVFKIHQSEIMRIHDDDKPMSYVSAKERCNDNKYQEMIRYFLNNYKEDERISADKIIQECFNQQNYDVFISYSSKDKDYASCLKYFIGNELKLKCFLDYDVWGNAYEIMNTIDDEFNRINCFQDRYEYEGVRQSSINVSMMLTEALTHMLEICPVVIFISSENSISNINGRTDKLDINDKTYSPWLYHEISMVNMMNRIQSGKRPFTKEASAIFEFSLDTSWFETIDDKRLLGWKKIRELYPNINILDIITKVKFH